MNFQDYPERCGGFGPDDAPANLGTPARCQCQPGHTGTIRPEGVTNGERPLTHERLLLFPGQTHRAVRGQSRFRRVHEPVLNAVVEAIAHASPRDWPHEITEQGPTVTVHASLPAGVATIRRGHEN
jgi:hypothetical protein